MNPTQRTYIAIDLKSFFASVECVERTGSAHHQPRRGRCFAHGEDYLPGGHPFAEGTWCRWPCPSVRGGATGAGGEPVALAPQLCALPVRKILRCPGAGAASRLGGGLHRGSTPDGLLHRIQPADL